MEAGGNVSDSVLVQGDGNTINIGGRKKPSGSSKRKTTPRRSPRYKVPIIVAWIGFLATVLAALITVFGNKAFPDPKPSSLTREITSTLEIPTITPSPAPTDTATPYEPTSTPAISLTDTSTPEPTFMPIPPVALGEDWIEGCISTLWIAYPSTIPTLERGDGCWREPVHVFSAENGNLDFLAERSRGPIELYGLFAPLPQSGTVTFTVRLRDLSNVDLWMGIFPSPEVDSDGLLMTIPGGDVRSLPVIQKNPRTYHTIMGTIPLNPGGGLSISFSFDILSVRSRVNPAVFVTNPVSIPSTQKWLFLGYRGLSGTYRIDGIFANFELKP